MNKKKKIDEIKETTRMKLTKIAKFVKKSNKLRKSKKHNYKLQIDVTPQWKNATHFYTYYFF